MHKPSPLDPLTSSQQNICTYGGIFGVLIALTCFIQLMIVGVDNWRIPVLLSVYIIAAASYFLLAFQKHFAPLLLIISAVLILMAQVIWILGLAFSFVVSLLLLYSIVMVVLVYASQVPAQLKKKKQALDAENASWEGRI
jgi:Na+-transporting methylmalonyl-CoA/oxaloacetate decarboxylase gamma subunit